MALKRFFRFAHMCTQKRRFVCPSIQNFFTHYPYIPPPLHTPTPAYPYPRHLLTMLGPQKEGVNTNFLRAGVERVWWVTVEDLTLPKEGCRISIQRVYLFRVATDMVFLNVRHFQGKSATKTKARFFFNKCFKIQL